MPTQLAAQLYTLREFTKTPADIAKTFKRVRELGYEAVQSSALGPIEAKELKKILDDTGLACCATHKSLEHLRDQTQQIIDEHKLWNCQYTAIGGYFPKAEQFTVEAWAKFVSDFNAVVDQFEGSGLSIGYHNHSHELAKPPGSTKTAYQMLVEGLSPKAWIELDTYWIQHGGGDPAWWIDRVKGRIPCIHLKDLGMKTDRTPFMMEVGQGNLNWDGILAACVRAGVQWYIVEQDTCYRDPFESLKISLEFLRGKGLR